MHFSDTLSQRELKQLMQGIPNFAPRGHGLFIPKAELTLYKNPNPPPTSLSDAIEKTMSAIYCPPFQRRLEQYLKESEKNPMNYRNEKHRIAFTEAIEKLNRKDYALMSAVYLLTAEHSLWMKAKHRVGQNEIRFDAIKLQKMIAEIDTEFKKMLNAVSEGNIENFNEGYAGELMNEKQRLVIQLEQYANTRHKRESAKSRLDQIFTILDGMQNHPMEYDNRIVRQILECVVVESKETIKVVFVGGLEVMEQLAS